MDTVENIRNGMLIIQFRKNSVIVRSVESLFGVESFKFIVRVQVCRYSLILDFHLGLYRLRFLTRGRRENRIEERDKTW